MEHGRYPKVKDAVKYGSGLVMVLDHEMNVKLALQFWVRWGRTWLLLKGRNRNPVIKRQEVFLPC